MDARDDIRFETRGSAGWVTLSRPQALNALTHAMCIALESQLRAWADDDAVRFVVIEGEGRAFSAGGDIQALYDARQNPLYRFFADEYRLNALIRRFAKPYVALIDGIVMGGGVGVSVHGSHRVLTQNATFAMPEVGIGFFPDVGGSYFLPRMAGCTGIWMGLTGARAKWGDCLAWGFATHCVEAGDLDALKQRLAQVAHPDAALAEFAIVPPPETSDADRAAIDRAFAGDSLDAILSAARHEADHAAEWAKRDAAAFSRHSPTSLHVALRQLREGGSLSMDDCMRMEYRIVTRMLQGADFYEGIRAAIIDKGDTPRWRPATLGEVSPGAVDAFFAALPGGELELQ